MVDNQHFQRLKHMYSSLPSGAAADQVAISYGRVELEGTIGTQQAGAVVERASHRWLLSDAASLAAGSLQKEHYVTTKQFTTDIVDADHKGPVVATAEVAMVEAPRYVVQAVLMSDDGDVVAEARGVFEATDDHLPESSPEVVENDAAPTPPPASFMPVHTTPYGLLCMN
ncbi:MAG: hypothetical protein BRD55_10595 [Bacteroidetes bacterium SW_9_63_38]|nr:MAG: hypothetical protein BRD55_10595 [Bacteroidetes bacterium SW_9_63_38]